VPGGHAETLAAADSPRRACGCTPLRRSCGQTSRGPSGFATHIHVSSDPLRNWLDQHQAQHRDTYTAAWRRPNPARAKAR
jgi:hypothetical protein